MTATAARQRTIVRQFKYPADDEARARVMYYREARERVVAYHRRPHEPAWLTNEAQQLDQFAAAVGGRAGARLRHNARSLRDYALHFSRRNFTVLNDLVLSLRHADVIVTVVPDLQVRENGEEKIIKLECTVGGAEPDEVRIISL